MTRQQPGTRPFCKRPPPYIGYWPRELRLVGHFPNWPEASPRRSLHPKRTCSRLTGLETRNRIWRMKGELTMQKSAGVFSIP